jgi:hypothetical protein
MELRKRFYVALAIYATLGLAIWLTVGDIQLGIFGAPAALPGVHITLRQLTLGLWALFVVRTVRHWRAEEIRSERERKENQVSS